MNRLLRSKGLRIITVVAIVGIAFVLVTRHFGPAARQADNLALARAHAARLQPQVRNDVRFADISLGANTGDGGSLWVYGSLASQQESNDLRRVVEASLPPVPVRYDLRMVPPDPGSTNH
jgi:hypothetical protein